LRFLTESTSSLSNNRHGPPKRDTAPLRAASTAPPRRRPVEITTHLPAHLPTRPVHLHMPLQPLAARSKPPCRSRQKPRAPRAPTGRTMRRPAAPHERSSCLLLLVFPSRTPPPHPPIHVNSLRPSPARATYYVYPSPFLRDSTPPRARTQSAPRKRGKTPPPTNKKPHATQQRTTSLRGRWCSASRGWRRRRGCRRSCARDRAGRAGGGGGCGPTRCCARCSWRPCGSSSASPTGSSCSSASPCRTTTCRAPAAAGCWWRGRRRRRRAARSCTTAVGTGGPSRSCCRRRRRPPPPRPCPRQRSTTITPTIRRTHRIKLRCTECNCVVVYSSI
jgi:hypothetical protein